MTEEAKQTVAVQIPRKLVVMLAVVGILMLPVAWRAYRDFSIRNKIVAAYPCGEDADTQEELDECDILTAALVDEAKQTCFSDDFDCGDFSVKEDAQSRLELCKVVRGSDIYGLDADNDGDACESLK